MMKTKSRAMSILALLLAVCMLFASCTTAPASSSQPEENASSSEAASSPDETAASQGDAAPADSNQLPVAPPPTYVESPIDKGDTSNLTPFEQLPELDKADPISNEPGPTDGPVYIFLTRHGETITNVSGRNVSGEGSAPLTDSGREVAYYLGLGLQDTYFKAVYSSTLSRTYETASIILEQNQTAARYHEINQHDGLREMAVGGFATKRLSELAEAGYNMRFVKSMADELHADDPTAESYAQVVNRAWSTIHEIAQAEAENGGGNILIVAHGGLNAVIARNLSYPDARSSLQNSSIVLLKYENGTLELLSYNDTSWIDRGRAMAETPEAVELNLVVTAETVEDTRSRFNSVLDSKVTEAGLSGAKATGAQLAPDGFRAVYASDLWKDVDTAKALISGSGNPYTIVHSSREMRGVQAGYYEGELLEGLPEVTGTTAKERITSFHENDPKEIAENYENAKEHVLAAYKGACDEIYATGGGKIAVVGSALTTQLVIEELTGAAAEPLVPGDVVTLIFDGNAFRLA